LKRTNVVKLMVDKCTGNRLRELGVATAKCWNEVNWLRMQQYKKGEGVDFGKTGKEVSEKYKGLLKVNTQQVAKKNAEAWRSFFELSRMKAEGRLPKWLKPRPPGYWKDGRGRYRITILIRNDRYVVDEGKRAIYLRDFKLTLRFKGGLKWRGRQGGLEIRYNEARKAWYAYIPVKVGDNAMVATGGLRASVDLGIVNLSTVYVEDGSWYVFKGGSTLSAYEHYSKRISRLQKVLARHRQESCRRLKALHEKRGRFLRHALNSMARKVMKLLKDRGVSEVVIGHPKEITRDHGNKLTANFWNYGYTIRRFKEIGEETGIKVTVVDESNTSKKCSLCGEVHENGRVKRGLFKCPRIGKSINADLNGAINILHTPESQGTVGGGLPAARDRGKGLKTQPVVYRWTSGAGWVEIPSPTSNEAMRMKAVNHKPVIRPEGTLALKGGEEVSGNR
jgi:putative transposase